MTGYDGEKVELEVARYALRTFHQILKPQAFNIYDKGIGMLPTTLADFYELGSIAIGGNHWSDGTCTAKCLGGMGMTFSCGDPRCPWCNRNIINHEAPHDKCSCGIYGCLSLEWLRGQYPDKVSNIVAVIAAEGQTIIGTRGLRTQFARVVAYWCINGGGYPEMAKRQFVGAQRYLGMSEMLRAYGLPWSAGPEETRSGLIRKFLGGKS
ncbi:hypothetical protein MINTMi27_15410 [Mycobacterium intracellulare]|uniref:hypothetical protein n=1 Tax=Mycobacterium intracellulare TaxID=1767 RepID=UPI001925D7E8|nr:hypothetical protein [Mycobacterium intracellulare]BCP41448.1 hypothetical protein MINTMi27_15410 [Mycobacterium intracellulare]